MALFSIPNVAIRGISACVPNNIEENINIPVFKEGEAERVIAQTGIKRKHVVKTNTTASDLCVKATNVLLEELGWEKNSIDALFYVTSASDYITPPTSCIIQGELDLPETCLSIEIKYGCPGWVIGLSTAAAYLTSGLLKRVLLLVGDASTLLNSPLDKETRPLFGDAGTCTALEYDTNASAMEFEHGTKGKDFKAIYTPVGGCRNAVTPKDLEFVEYGPNQVRRNIDCTMDGMSVFAFGMSVAPKSVKQLVEKYSINLENIDFLLLHQANRYMNDKIRKKLQIDSEKTPYSLFNYGNTSCASIPLTIVTQCKEEYSTKSLESIASAFGVGLAWASVHFKTHKIVCPKLILY